DRVSGHARQPVGADPLAGEPGGVGPVRADLPARDLPAGPPPGPAGRRRPGPGATGPDRRCVGGRPVGEVRGRVRAVPALAAAGRPQRDRQRAGPAAPRPGGGRLVGPRPSGRAAGRRPRRRRPDRAGVPAGAVPAGRPAGAGGRGAGHLARVRDDRGREPGHRGGGRRTRQAGRHDLRRPQPDRPPAPHGRAGTGAIRTM
ncbi:MAG: probable extracytoplasmic function alternative sigma factor, partial [uncultured Phycisphaerae bacterium]